MLPSMKSASASTQSPLPTNAQRRGRAGAQGGESGEQRLLVPPISANAPSSGDASAITTSAIVVAMPKRKAAASGLSPPAATRVK